MWSYELQWLSASVPGVQSPLPSVGTWCSSPVDLGAQHSTPLCLSDLAPSSRSEGFFVLSSLHLILEEITPHPPCLFAIKGTLQSLFNSFRILQKMGTALVLEQLLLSTLLSLQVSFVSSLLLVQKSLGNSHQ